MRYPHLYPAFVGGEGRQTATYVNRGLDPGPAGYRRWRDRLIRVLSQDRALHPRQPR